MYYFYPRSPCGERLFLLFRLVAGFLFLSTLSLRRATALSLPFGAVWIISIHALLAESDNKNLLLKRSRFIFLSTLSLRRATEHTNNGSNANLHFYPRSPCGERLALDQYLNEQEVFLSTLSLRRATKKFGFCDLEPIRFLSTLSLRRATMTLVLACVIIVFLSTLSLRRATP